jgi:chromate transporter
MLMVAAYVCYKVAGIMGAVVAAGAIFLPSFMLMLSVLPMFECVRTLMWTRAPLKGVGPAEIGVMVVSLMQMAQHALPDPWAIAMLIGTLIALLAWRIGVLKLMMAGAGLGVLRSRLLALPGASAIF